MADKFSDYRDILTQQSPTAMQELSDIFQHNASLNPGVDAPLEATPNAFDELNTALQDHAGRGGCSSPVR